MQADRCMFLIELLIGELPAMRQHHGPPIWNRENADKFRKKHLAEHLSGPFIEDGRYEMEVPRNTRPQRAFSLQMLS